MKHILSIYVLATLFLACKPATPSLSWENEKAVQILADLRMMDNQIKRHHHLHRDSVRDAYLSLLLDIHKITEEELNMNIEIIQNDAHLMKEMEDRVYDLMNQRLKELSNKDE